MFEQQEIEPSVQVPTLGENAYEQKVQNENINDEGYFGKPEKYDYSGVKLPENYCYNEELLNEFNDLAAKYNLSQKSADELMSVAVKLTELMSNNYSAALAEQNRQKVENYKKMLFYDRDLGGVNLEDTMRTANIAYVTFADDEVQKLLSESGLNCHPKVVKMFYNIGQKMKNDQIFPMNYASVPRESREDILFPTMS